VFCKKAIREEAIIKQAKYFFGRTNWDKQVIGLMNSGATYYHCDEVLRPAFYKAKWTQKSQSELILVSVMNPSIYKGLDIILEAANLLKRYSNIKFEWRVYGMNAGNNVIKLFEKLKKKKFSDNNVQICGSKSEQQLMNCLLNADIYIHPSHIDNSPNSVCEAQMLGLPVIATNVGGISSIIETEVNGLLYNSGDPYELVFLIKRLVKDASLANKISRNAREIAHERHHAPSIVSNIKESYRSMLNVTTQADQYVI
jgi:glycosyltransferase involved in cell wall biosynthesis